MRYSLRNPEKGAGGRIGHNRSMDLVLSLHFNDPDYRVDFRDRLIGFLEGEGFLLTLSKDNVMNRDKQLGRLSGRQRPPVPMGYRSVQVMELILNKPGITTKELIEATGCVGPDVYLICKRLLLTRTIVCVKVKVPGRGKDRNTYYINPGALKP